MPAKLGASAIGKYIFLLTMCGNFYQIWSSEGRKLPELSRTSADAMADLQTQTAQHRLITAQDHIEYGQESIILLLPTQTEKLEES